MTFVFAKSNVPEGRLTDSPAFACPTRSRPSDALKLSSPDKSKVAMWEPAVALPCRTTRLPVPPKVKVPPEPETVTGVKVLEVVAAPVLPIFKTSPVVVRFTVKVWPELMVVVCSSWLSWPKANELMVRVASMVVGVPAPTLRNRASSAVPGAARVSQLAPRDQLPPVAFQVVTAPKVECADNKATTTAETICGGCRCFIYNYGLLRSLFDSRGTGIPLWRGAQTSRTTAEELFECRGQFMGTIPQKRDGDGQLPV